MVIRLEWNNFFDFVFQTKFCMYNHRRDDIRFEIVSLCVLRNLSIENSFLINNISIVQEHLENLLCFGYYQKMINNDKHNKSVNYKKIC